MGTLQKTRRYDLDWLRVLVFTILILFHVGMFFVPWGWHLKNNVIVEWIEWPMTFVSQWRLPILFVISGMGTRYALSHRSAGVFAKERITRLGTPLLVGMLLVIPPQVYFERLGNGLFGGSYWEYLTTVAFNGIYPEGNISWHHLWFLPYLLVISLILIPVMIHIRDHEESRFMKWLTNILTKFGGLYIFTLPLYLAEVFIEPFFDVTHALIDDWFALTNYLIFFLSGFLMISCKSVLWSSMERHRNSALILGIIAFTLQVFIWQFLEDSLFVHITEALLKVINIWSWIIVLFGYAALYLNKSSKLLSYCNRAVYPFYILHQSVQVAICYYIMNSNMSVISKFIILVIGTFGITWLIYEFLIRRIKWLHPLFGLK